MAYAYSANGMSWRAVEADWPLADGEVLFAEAPTTEQLAGAFPDYSPPLSVEWQDYRARAQALLDKSDVTILRCYEKSVPVPAEWAAYRDSLRAVVGAKLPGAGAIEPLPMAPPYPAGT